MPRIHAADHHDPFWDMDGKGARRTRLRRKFVRTAVYLVALMTLLAASILIGLSWMRRAPH